jgi:hypothetical protein
VQPLQTLAVILGVIAFASVVFVLLPRALLIGLRQSLEARARTRYPAPGALLWLDCSANLFGSYSRGVTQWRGNGALALTETELTFFQLVPERVLVIPISRISALEIVPKHMGKSTHSSDLLRVTFRTKQGGADVVAYWLPKPAELKARLEGCAAYAPGPVPGLG